MSTPTADLEPQQWRTKIKELLRAARSIDPDLFDGLVGEYQSSGEVALVSEKRRGQPPAMTDATLAMVFSEVVYLSKKLGTKTAAFSELAAANKKSGRGVFVVTNGIDADGNIYRTSIASRALDNPSTVERWYKAGKKKYENDTEFARNVDDWIKDKKARRG